MKKPSVMIGMPIGSGSLPWPTAVSLISTVRVLDKEGLKFKIEAPTGCSIVQWARSAIAGAFLRSDFTHLFWIDADLSWHPNDFFRILGFAAVHDVVGATYPFKKEPAGFLINFPEEDKVEVNGLGLVKIVSMGLGFTCVKRAVVEKIAATKPRVIDQFSGGLEIADLFRVDRSSNGGARGEDVAFFHDAREQGFDAWLDPSITLDHIGQKAYRGNVIDELGLQDYAKEVRT